MKKRTWYEKYLPFVSRSPEMQIRWLETALRKGPLSLQEITPYIRLLLGEHSGEEHLATLRPLLDGFEPFVVDRMLMATDIYDMPTLFCLFASPSLEQAIIAITKEPPPYEKTPEQVLHRVFQAVYDCSEELLAEAARRVMAQAEGPPGFREAYERFMEIKEDEKLLSALYPKAIV